MTPTDYDWGVAVQAQKHLEHGLRNLKQTVLLQDAEAEALVEEVQRTKAELQRLKIEIRTVLTVLGGMASTAAWLFR
jgi:hypothetical protein